MDVGTGDDLSVQCRAGHTLIYKKLYIRLK
jgi:hypothetical protein